MLAQLLAFILLTQLDGSPVWVESNAIQAIKPNSRQAKSCHASAGAVVRLGALALCVKETPEEIRRQIER